MMKRFFALLLCALALLNLASCGKTEKEIPAEATAASTPVTEPAPTAAPTEAPTEAPTAPVPMGETVLVDNESAAFTVVSAENSEHLGMQLQVLCVNRSSRALMFTWEMVSVCGYMYDPFWAEEVPAGKSAVSTVYLDTYELGKMGITSVDEVTFTLRIYDSENWMDEPLVADVFTVYPTGLNAGSVAPPSRAVSDAHTVVAEDENIRCVIEGISHDADGCRVYVYLENRTSRNLLYGWDLVSVNGCMTDPFWSASVGAGKNACCEVFFPRSELERCGIADVSEIGFTLTVSDYDDWEAGYLLENAYTYNP